MVTARARAARLHATAPRSGAADRISHGTGRASRERTRRPRLGGDGGGARCSPGRRPLPPRAAGRRTPRAAPRSFPRADARPRRRTSLSASRYDSLATPAPQPSTPAPRQPHPAQTPKTCKGSISVKIGYTRGAGEFEKVPFKHLVLIGSSARFHTEKGAGSTSHRASADVCGARRAALQREHAGMRGGAPCAAQRMAAVLARAVLRYRRK